MEIWHFLKNETAPLQAISALLAASAAFANLYIIYIFTTRSEKDQLKNRALEELSTCISKITAESLGLKKKSTDSMISYKETDYYNDRMHSDQYKVLHETLINCSKILGSINQKIKLNNLNKLKLQNILNILQDIEFKIAEINGINFLLENYIQNPDAVEHEIDASSLIHGYHDALAFTNNIYEMLNNLNKAL